MKRRPGGVIAGFTAAACALAWVAQVGEAKAQAASAQSEAAKADWVELLDGRNLDNFTPIGAANWQVVDGVAQANAGNGQLVSNESYRDFELVVEFWVSPDANSGVFLRCDNREEINPTACYEVNIFDQRPDQTYRTGAIVDVAAPSKVIETGNRWNTYRIVARGSHLTINLNGVETVDVENDRRPEGPFSLQYGAGTVKFRAVRIRRL